MGKKGQIELTTIIGAIIVVTVLIVLITFFLGGFGKIRDTITNVFYPITSGTDLAIAVQTCEQRCDQARLLPDSIMKNSAYCTSSFNIDYNGDGEADTITEGDKTILKKFYCYNKEANSGTLNVPCQVKYKNQDKELSDVCLGNAEPK